jgi:hypothetical protein
VIDDLDVERRLRRVEEALELLPEPGVAERQRAVAEHLAPARRPQRARGRRCRWLSFT